jgi:hypothetical protein
MDAYAAQMAAMTTGGAVATGGSSSSDAAADADADAADRAAAEMLDAARSTIASSSASSVGVPPLADVDAYTSIAMLESSQTLSVSKIASSIPDLALKPDASYDSSSDFVIGSTSSNRVKLGASDAPGPANVAWLSDLCVESRLSSLTIYSGPLTNVPHLISRCSIDESTGDLSLFVDFRPRSYGAYEMRNPSTGEYPGPETLGRKSFEYSGARRDYETKFGNDDVSIFLRGVRSSLNGAIDNPKLGDAGLSALETLTRGPLALDVTMPLGWVFHRSKELSIFFRFLCMKTCLTLICPVFSPSMTVSSAENLNAIISAREKAVNIWLGWALDASHRHKPGAPVNGQYVYDSKYKINAYLALLDVYVKFFGQKDGERLAAADSGPIDEAYVGGGS